VEGVVSDQLERLNSRQEERSHGFGNHRPAISRSSLGAWVCAVCARGQSSIGKTGIAKASVGKTSI
jgi:hypothetical protein